MSKPTYIPFNSVAEMRKELSRLRSCWSGESILNTRMLLWFCEQVSKGQKRKGQRSKWNEFCSIQLKQGKSMTQIGAEWRAQKSKP